MCDHDGAMMLAAMVPTLHSYKDLSARISGSRGGRLILKPLGGTFAAGEIAVIAYPVSAGG
ncbi:hypothetical protein [Leisingera methylohalidivorans]|nr:hypothetical protein [Leisingera methylohalidivorans]